MKSLTDTYTLSNGVKIPVIGFGTWQVEDGREAVDAVKAALSAGYRHIDTAQGYGNEESVGRAVKDSGVKRDEIFITSKLVNSVRGYKQTKAALDESLGKLGGYIDLFLLHWPVPVDFKQNWKEMNAESWRAMEEHFQAGKLRALGVSNFHGRHVDELLKTAKVKPVVNQIRLCPGDTQDEVVAYSREKGMLLEAYSPLGVGAVLQVPQMQELAAKYGKSVAQVAIRWSLQNGFLPLPKSITPVRIRENANVFDFELSPDDMRIISALKGVAGVHADPDNITW
jgi:diketogulonate reductase-like aldo/keto reductase